MGQGRLVGDTGDLFASRIDHESLPGTVCMPLLIHFDTGAMNWDRSFGNGNVTNLCIWGYMYGVWGKMILVGYIH